MTLQEMKNIQDLINLAQEKDIIVEYKVVDLDTGDIIDEDYDFGRIEKSYNEAILQVMEDCNLDREEANDYVSLRVTLR